MTKVVIEGARNFLLRNCTFEYVKITRLVEYQGVMQWEMTISTEDPKQAEYWDDNWLNVKSDATPTKQATRWWVALNRKAKTADGTENEPVGAKWANLKALSPDESRQIGNGSKGNVIIWQGQYDNQWGKGVTSSLTAIQVLEFEKYEGGLAEMEFDLEDPEGADMQFGAETGGDEPATSEDKPLF